MAPWRRWRRQGRAAKAPCVPVYMYASIIQYGIYVMAPWWWWWWWFWGRKPSSRGAGLQTCHVCRCKSMYLLYSIWVEPWGGGGASAERVHQRAHTEPHTHTHTHTHTHARTRAWGGCGAGGGSGQQMWREVWWGDVTHYTHASPSPSLLGWQE